MMYVDGIRTIEMHNYKEIEGGFRRRIIITSVFPCKVPEAYLKERLLVSSHCLSNKKEKHGKTSVRPHVGPSFLRPGS